MKKIIFSLFLLCIMVLSVSAAPQLPYIVYGKVDWNDQLLIGSRLEVTHKGTTTKLTTNDKGFWVYQLSDYSTGDSVVVKVTDGCGTGDTCQKSINVGSTGYEDYAIIDFSITGTLSCPSCPSCGSCGGGGGGYVDLATEERCLEKFPCEDAVSKVCPKPEECPAPTKEECESIVCPDAEICEECPESDCDNIDFIIGIIAAIVLFIGGGLKIYKNRAGGTTILHRHRGIIGYHNPNTTHRKVSIRHAGLSDDPKQYLIDLKKIDEGVSL